MSDQLDLFGAPEVAGADWPEGFRFAEVVISREQEQAVLARIQELPFSEFEFHGYVGKRRTVSFGWSYDFAEERLQAAEPMPEFLLELRQVAAAFAELPADRLQQGLVTEYAAGAGIGWHRDKGVFAEIVGLSFLSACPFRLRRKRGTNWERITVNATPRSAYLLSGPARTEWEHSIAAVEAPRYSVTFRSLR